MKRTNNSKAETAANYSIKVTRVKEFDNAASFDMEVNGVSIYGCWYRICKGKDGNEFPMISFPSHKGNDGKYYSYAYFQITDDMKSDIINQIEGLL